MKLYNKSGRAFIIRKEDAIDGCRTPTDAIGRNKAYIDPNTTVDVEDNVGEKLLHDYPGQLMRVDQVAKSSKRKTVKKAKAKKPAGSAA